MRLVEFGDLAAPQQKIPWPKPEDSPEASYCDRPTTQA
jgi:hypothetical protein